MARRTLTILTILFLLTSFATTSSADNPLDDDARSGGDAPDDADDAMLLELPLAILGRVTPQVDQTDHYRFYAEAETGLEFRTSHAEGVFVGLEGPEGQWFSVGGKPLRILTESAGEWSLFAVASYIPLGVSTVGVADGYYWITAKTIGIPAQDDAASSRDAGGSVATAVPVSEGTFRGETGQYDQRDGFLIDVAAGKTLVATATSDTGNPVSLGLNDLDEQRLTLARGGEATARYVFDEVQTVLVRVSMGSGLVEPYTLQLETNDDDRLPDLELVTITSTSEPSTFGGCGTVGGYRTEVAVAITNAGETDAGRFDVHLKATAALGTCTYGFGGNGLSAGDTDVFRFVVSHEPGVSPLVEVVVDPRDNVQESNEANNEGTHQAPSLI